MRFRIFVYLYSAAARLTRRTSYALPKLAILHYSENFFRINILKKVFFGEHRQGVQAHTSLAELSSHAKREHI